MIILSAELPSTPEPETIPHLLLKREIKALRKEAGKQWRQTDNRCAFCEAVRQFDFLREHQI